MGLKPATEQMITETEKRLGVPLPPSLRGFLLVSNG
ncbi:SMI1/KNR4 family protein [Amycolatopsis sp. WAC 04197]